MSLNSPRSLPFHNTVARHGRPEHPMAGPYPISRRFSISKINKINTISIISIISIIKHSLLCPVSTQTITIRTAPPRQRAQPVVIITIDGPSRPTPSSS